MVRWFDVGCVQLPFGSTVVEGDTGWSSMATATCAPCLSDVPVILGCLIFVRVGEVMVTIGSVSAADAAMLLVSRVTAAPRAISRPSIEAPVVAVIHVCARIVPLNCDQVPSVAQLPTTQNTFAACAPFVRSTVLTAAEGLTAAVTSVDTARKMETEFGLPPPSSVTVPVSPNELPAE